MPRKKIGYPSVIYFALLGEGQCTGCGRRHWKGKGGIETYKSTGFFKVRACNCFFSELFPMSTLREAWILRIYHLPQPGNAENYEFDNFMICIWV